MPSLSHAQNYQLDKTSDLLGSCGYIHTDKYSFNDVLVLIQEQLKNKLEKDHACSAPLAQLNSQLIEMDTYFNRQITELEKKEMAKAANKDYLVDLESEMMMLNPADPAQAARMATLQSLIDSVKATSVTLGVEAQLAALEDKDNANMAMSQKWENVYANSAAAVTTLNSLPSHCVDRLGGWKNMIPVVMKLASAAGPLVGGVAGPIITAGFEMGGQLAILLRNNRLKGAISSTLRVQNSQIIACTYSVLQTNACELKRAKTLMDDKQKITDLINQRITDTKNAEYEAYYLQVSKLNRVQKIFKDIGSMGSALTLDLELLGMYFAAVRLDPENITDIPKPNASDAELTDFLIRMKARGAEWSTRNMNGGMSTLKQQYTDVIAIIDSYKAIIKTAQAIMTKKQSFYDLKSEIIASNQYVAKEITSLHTYTVSYLNSGKLPSQYRADFATNERMLRRIKDYLTFDYTGSSDQEYLIYLEDINEKGRQLFEEMSRGSIAQITAQTVLMVPDIAFKRFNRPFKNLEKYYLGNDIIHKDDPTYAPFTDFVITRSMQSKFNSYPEFHGTSEAFRVDTYLAAREGLEKGFKREIIRMVKSSMEKKSDILEAFNGKTAGHLCALYASFLKEESPQLFQKCQAEYTSLSLLPILSEADRPSSMKIDYADPCFYNSYKQEEEGQRRLFEVLIDYGSRNNLILVK
jgi:hypothetical protein